MQLYIVKIWSVYIPLVKVIQVLLPVPFMADWQSEKMRARIMNELFKKTFVNGTVFEDGETVVRLSYILC